MKLKNLTELIGDEDQTVIIFKKDDWAGSFRCCCIPNEYNDCTIEAIMPDFFEGYGFGQGSVIKVWIVEDKECK